MKIVGKTIVERRRDQRAKLPPITLMVDGVRHVTSEWTLGGFLIRSYSGTRHVGEIIGVRIRVEAGVGRTYEHYADAQVARVERERRQLGARFIKLDEGAVETLEGWLTGRLRRRAKVSSPASRA